MAGVFTGLPHVDDHSTPPEYSGRIRYQCWRSIRSGYQRRSLRGNSDYRRQRCLVFIAVTLLYAIRCSPVQRNLRALAIQRLHRIGDVSFVQVRVLCTRRDRGVSEDLLNGLLIRARGPKPRAGRMTA